MELMAYLIFLRHGESIKNVQDRHGGPGANLIPKAEEEIRNAAKTLIQVGIQPVEVYTSPVPQAIQTAHLLGSFFEVSVSIEPLLKPLDLGVLSGLSHQEAKKLYPYPAALMEMWRRGEIELHQLVLPGAEDYRMFYDRGQRFLTKCEDSKKNMLIVGTRSILICLVSILLGRTIEPGGGYREIPISCCDFFVFKRNSGKYNLEIKYSKCSFSDNKFDRGR
jgi:broad specificity phosphatase PhoE